MSNTVKLIYGDDNGVCSLWDITKAEYDSYRERLDELEYGEKEEATAYEKLEKEFYAHRITITAYDDGYVPDYVVQLAKTYGIDTDSN